MLFDWVGWVNRVLEFLRNSHLWFCKNQGFGLSARHLCCKLRLHFVFPKFQHFFIRNHFSWQEWGASPAQPSFWRQSEARKWKQWKHVCQNRGSWRWAKMWWKTHTKHVCVLPSAVEVLTKCRRSMTAGLFVVITSWRRDPQIGMVTAEIQFLSLHKDWNGWLKEADTETNKNHLKNQP